MIGLIDKYITLGKIALFSLTFPYFQVGNLGSKQNLSPNIEILENTKGLEIYFIRALK